MGHFTFRKHARDPNACKKVPVLIRGGNKIAAPKKKKKSSLADNPVRAGLCFESMQNKAVDKDFFL